MNPYRFLAISSIELAYINKLISAWRLFFNLCRPQYTSNDLPVFCPVETPCSVSE